MSSRVRRIGRRQAGVITQVSTYTTTFAATENPISESGAWTRNQSNAWTNMRTTGGNAVGTQVDNSFDDSYAIKSGDWGANYKLSAIVFRSGSISAANHEVELNVRFLDDADSVRGYEVLLNKDGIIQCFRWNDSFGSFTEVALASGTDSVGSVPNGAAYEVQISGNIITVRYDSGGGAPSQVCTYDVSSIGGSNYSTGNPAIAAFCRPSAEGSNPDHFGFQSLTITRI